MVLACFWSVQVRTTAPIVQIHIPLQIVLPSRMVDHLDPPYNPDFPRIDATPLTIETSATKNVPHVFSREDHEPHLFLIINIARPYL